MRTDPGHGSWFCTVCKYVRQYDRFLSQCRGISGDDEPADGWQEHVFPDRVHGNHSTTCGGDRVPLADLSETPGLYALRCCDRDLRSVLWHIKFLIFFFIIKSHYIFLLSNPLLQYKYEFLVFAYLLSCFGILQNHKYIFSLNSYSIFLAKPVLLKFEHLLL